MQPSLFDETSLIEIQHGDYRGQRLIACGNPVLGRNRVHKRQAFLAATVQELEPVQQRVWNGRLKGWDKIGLKVGEPLGRQ